jgi:hypothetical protein
MPISAIARHEWIADISIPTLNTRYMLPSGNIPNDRFMYSMRLQFEGRMTNPGNTHQPTAVLADAPYSLIDLVTISGTHRPRNNREDFIIARGADLFEWNKVYLGTGANQISTPATLSASASATNDVRFIIDIPFTPLVVPARERLAYLLDTPNYDQLQLFINFADAASVFVLGDQAVTFSAYGSATGNPRIRVSGTFAMGGAGRFANFVPGRVFRQYNEIVSGDIVAGATASRLFNLNRGYRIRSALLKTGVKSAAVTSGNNAYLSRSSTILTNIKVVQGLNKQIRFWADQFALQADSGFAYSSLPDAGYTLIDFANQGLLGESLRTQGLVAGPTGDVDLFIQADIAGDSAQGALILPEELRYTPGTLFSRRSQVSMAGVGAR